MISTALRLPTTVAAVRAELDGRNYAALSHLMEFDCPIEVHADGRVTDGPAGVYAPDLYDDELDTSGPVGNGWGAWELLDGYSGQDRYAGPIMHDSEFIGGGMARDILDQPGVYVAVAAYYSAEHTHEALGAGSVLCRNCDAPIEPDGAGGWTSEDGADSGGDSCPADDTGTHDPEDQEGEGWAVARLLPAYV
jgi:hypothetical protein